MSAMEKHVAQIFDRTKRIIEQARQECHLWEHHLFPKLILNGVVPPPWLCDSALHSLPSDPKELNKDDIVSGVLLSQTQFRVPFPGHHCSLYGNLDVVSDDVRYPIGLRNEIHAFEKDCDRRDRLSNLPDCSVNNAGCASSGPPEMDSGAISPQNQIEPRISESYNDPAMSLAKLQRSKSRQKALELRNSAKPSKRLSGDDNNAAAVKGSASSTLQEDHIKELGLVNDLHANIQSCSIDEVRRGNCLTQNDHKSNNSGHITRSKSLSQKFNSLNVGSSSVEKEHGPLLNDSNEALELDNRPCFVNGSCGIQEANIAEFQNKEAGSSVYDKRLTKPRSSGQAGHSSELLNCDSTLGRDERVEVSDLKQPCSHVELTNLSKASDCNNGSRRSTYKDGDLCQTKQESNIQSRIRLPRSSCPSPGDDFFTIGGSVKSTDKSVQLPQPSVLKNSQNRSVSVVGSFGSQKDPDNCAVKTKERLGRSGSGKVYLTRNSKLLKSLNSNSHEQSTTCSDSAGKKSQNVQSTKMDARKLSSSPKCAKLDIEISMNSAEKDNIAALAASRNTGAVTSCTNEGLLRPASSSNLNGESLHAESLYNKTAVAEKVLNIQENTLSVANPTDNAEHRYAATLAKVHADFGGFVEKDPSCLGFVNPKVGEDVSILTLPSDFVMSVMPKQLVFDDVEETSMSGISSPDLKEGRQGMSPEKEPLNLSEPLKLLEDETQEGLTREEGSQMKYCASRLNEADTTRKALNAMSPSGELPMAQKELCILTSSLMNHSNPSQAGTENSSGNLSKEVTASRVVSANSKLENDQNENDQNSTNLADSFSAAVTENVMHKYTDKSVTNLTVGFPIGVPADEVNVDLAQQAPNTISLGQNGDLLRQTLLSDGNITSFSSDIQNFKSSTESFTYDVEHSCSQHKRRKIEIETEKFLPDSTHFLEKPVDSIDQRPASGTMSIEQDNPEAVLEIQHFASDQENDIGHEHVRNSPTDVMQDTMDSRKMERSSRKFRKEEKLVLDGRGRNSDILMLAEANPLSFSLNSTMRCAMDEKAESWHLQVNSGHDSAEHLTCVERSTSSRGIYPRGNAEVSEGLSVSPGIQNLDLIGTHEALPEFERFVMQTDNAQLCTAGDQMELENMNLPSKSVDYTSVGRSRFLRSPLCYSSTPYKLNSLTNLYQSLPNGLLEGYGLRTSPPLNDGSPRALSDCLPNCKDHYTSSVQTLWDRISSNFGSSGKHKSLKPELPCINEENENVDEIACTFQNDIGSERMTGSITRGPLAEIIDNANPSTSALQDDVPTGGCDDFVSTEFSFSGTHNKVKKKLDKQDGNRKRFTSKGEENHSISLGANGAKRTSESVRKRSSRPKLSGKYSMKQQRPTYSGKKSTCKNIVSNVTSFIPLVQQKQAAAVLTGKRDIKVKALEAAEAAKRMAEKKENERKMKKEVLRLEREKVEQQNLRHLELQKKKKEEERKKEAEMAARKRQREDEEKKEKERKRKRVNDMKQLQQEHVKIHAKKEEIKAQTRATGEEVHDRRKFMDERDNHNNLQPHDNREGNAEKISEAEPLTKRDSANDKTKECCLEYSESVNDCASNGKVMVDLIKAVEDDGLILKNSHQEQSYDISPYRASDDEDEDDDDVPNNKFIPSWASKHSLSLIVSSQKIDPETIFPRQSFCNIAEVLLPRKLPL